MAKKRRIIEKEAQEEYEFVPPEFDEEEFIRKDLYGTKVLLIVACFSIIIGVLCSCLQLSFADKTGLWLGLLLLFLGIAVVGIVSAALAAGTSECKQKERYQIMGFIHHVIGVI